MKNFISFLMTLLLFFPGLAQEKLDLSYYLPSNVTYNKSIPTPKMVIGHEVGEWHITHDKLVQYMKVLAEANPARIKLVVTGTTNEGRQQLLLFFSSTNNINQLEFLRQEHLSLSDPSKSSGKDLSKIPAVVWMGYSIHGNESSGANASMLAAYHLAAAQGPEINELLEHTIILLDPSFNPDGLQRFSTWANQHKSKNVVTDPNSREYNEVWPGGRFNHYWFDLNRDWLPAVHLESQNRLKYFQDWKPNIFTDHHEMGTTSSFFFQPGVLSRVNSLTPLKNQELTAKIGEYHAKYLDQIGSLYFTKEGYDDFYYGKGSTFPDVQGGIGILFEQASSRGHAQETPGGIITFPFTIRNQFTTTLSTLDAARNMRMELLSYQRDFYSNASSEARQLPVKGYVFGDAHNMYNSEAMATMMQRHKIDVRKLNADYKAGKKTFEKDKAFFVPLNQPQFRLIRSIFEKQLNYQDSLFYDVTAWTMPLAYGVSYSEVTDEKSLGNSPVWNGSVSKGSFTGTKNDYAWLLDWRDFEAARALYYLQEKGIRTKVVSKPFVQTVNGSVDSFPAGTIVIPFQIQDMKREDVAALLMQVAEKYEVNIKGISTGLAIRGIDIGSRNDLDLTQPKIAMLVGDGISATDAGEVWHLMDQRLDIPATHLEIETFNRVDLRKYTTIIMVSGSQRGLDKEKLKSWIEDGGVLIACEDAVQWCSRNGISKLQFKKGPAVADSSKMLTYGDKSEIDGAQRMTGSIFRADIDLTHPLCFGLQEPAISMFKTNSVFLLPSKNPFASPVRYGNNPLESGFITKQNYEALKGTASVVVQTVGRGRVIHMADNPNFRAFWLGSMKLFVNALFFGDIIDAGSARAED